MASKTSSSEKESGRGRLQRESIVQTALNLMNHIGLDALSLRRLADELDVQAPALYWHFENKQALLDDMAEAMLIAAYPFTPEVISQREWSDFLLLMGHSLRKALLTYRDGARLLVSADVSRVGIQSLDLALRVLVEAGFSYREALVGIMTIVNFTLGFVFEEQSTVQEEGDAETLQKLVTSQDLPYLAAAFQENIAPFDSETEFEASLQLLMDGLRTRL